MALRAQNMETSFLEKDTHTEEEYFDWEDRSPHRWEFLPQGEPDEHGRRLGMIRAMSGGMPEHSAIAANLITSLANELRLASRTDCRPYGSDLKVHCSNGRNTYPDVTVACQPLQSYRNRRDIIQNPVLVAEVLSPTTSDDDQGDKWRSYQTIPTLQYYLLIAADRMRVEMYTRDGSEWRYQVWEDPQARLPLPLLGITLSLAELYIQVELQESS